MRDRVSFKVAKVGTRYRPKVGLIEGGDQGNDALEEDDFQQGNITAGGMNPGRADDLANPELLPSIPEGLEVSFSLNLFPDGYCVGKASQVPNGVSTKLLPYNRESESLFTAIEYGWLPGDAFDDIPCKYVDGAVLCEIRDYRNCLSQRSCTVKPPVIHRVLLRMCMENVIKDIQSLSDDSWSYKDKLEVESRILKVLQPELNLIPKPLLENYPGKPLQKKINLGISQAWKRRKRNDEPEPAGAATDSSQNHTSNCQSGLMHHGKAAPCSQQAVPVSVQTSQENVAVHLQPAQKSHCQSGLRGKAAPHSQQAASISVQTLQENVIVHSQPARNSNCQSGLVDRCKAAPCSQQAVLISVQTLQENAIAHSQPDPLMKNTLSNGRGRSVGTFQTSSVVDPPQNQHLISFGNDVREEGSLAPIDRGRLTEATQRPVMKQPKLEIVDFFQDQSSARQAEYLKTLRSKNTLSCQNTESEKTYQAIHDKEGYILSSAKSGWQGSPGGIPTLWNGIPASIVNERSNMTNTIHRFDAPRINNPNFVTSMGNNRYNLPSSPLLTANTSSTNSHGTQIRHPVFRSVRDEVVDPKSKALQNESSVLDKQRKRGYSLSILDSLAGTSSISAANAVNFSEGNVNFPPNSVAQGSLFHRFLKIEELTQRFQLNERKRKLDQILPKKPFSRIFPLVGMMLEEDSDSEKQKYPIMERTLLSNCFVDKRLNVSKTRILVYVPYAHIYHGYEFPKIDTRHKIRMLITEKLHDQKVEAKLLYGEEEESPLLMTFPNPHSADLFATQFTSLIAREGYCLVTDRVAPIPVNETHSLSSQLPAIMVSNDTQISGTPLEQPSSTTMPRAMADTMSAGEPLQIGGLLPSGSDLSRLALDVSAQLNYNQPHSRRAHSLFQTTQRERQQQQLLQSKLMMERLGAGTGSLGPIRLGDGSQGLNTGLGRFDNLLRLPGVGQIPGNVNFGQSQNLGGFIPDRFPAASMSPRTAEGRGRALMRGSGVVPTSPTYLDMAYVLNNQQPPRPLLHHQKILRQHPMRQLPLQAPASLTETAIVSSLPTNLAPLQPELQPQLNQGSSASQPMNRGNMINNRQTQLSSPTQESASSGGNSGSFSRGFADFT